jgi:hypothetical protein
MIPMKKCRAYYPIAGSRTVWIPCVQKAEAESGFCRRHGDAILGAMLGAIVDEKAMGDLLTSCAQQAAAQRTDPKNFEGCHGRRISRGH